jgi:hypothetical protein
MERLQLTENDRKTLINAAAFGLKMPVSDGGLTKRGADEIDAALVEAIEHIATTSDDCAYIIIRVDSSP